MTLPMPQPLIGKQEGELYHILKCLIPEEIEYAIRTSGCTEDYVAFGRLPQIIELRKFFQKYPLPYKLPNYNFIRESIKTENDCGGLGGTSLKNPTPHSLEVFLPIELEYYKFTGAYLLPDTFQNEKFAHFFKPWKDEHSKRLKVLLKIIEEYKKSTANEEEDPGWYVKEYREYLRDCGFIR